MFCSYSDKAIFVSEKITGKKSGAKYGKPLSCRAPPLKRNSGSQSARIGLRYLLIVNVVNDGAHHILKTELSCVTPI
jgi:hypothetical protein